MSRRLRLFRLSGLRKLADPTSSSDRPQTPKLPFGFALGT